MRRIRVDLETGAASGDLPAIQIAQFEPSLPPRYARWCDILELTGQIGADDIEYDPRKGARCAINLSHVTLSVPFDESEFDGAEARSGRMLRLREVSGRIVFEPPQARVDLAGLLNGEPVHVAGTLSGCDGPMEAMGYDLRIEVSRVALPNARDDRVIRQIGLLGSRAAKILDDFEPTAGWASFEGSLSRPAGQGHSAKFRGVLRMFEAAGRYDAFPYHGRNVRSTIRFTDDGIVFDVLARRGDAFFEVKGWSADGSSHSDADVTVEAVAVPLDEEMYQALPAKLRALWSHFDFYGQFSCTFHLWRIGGTPEAGPAPWRSSVHMAPHDVAARYEGFDFMQWGLHGTIDAADGLISKIDLWAINLDAVTRITGTADLRDEHRAVDLRVTARNRKLDG